MATAAARSTPQKFIPRRPSVQQAQTGSVRSLNTRAANDARYKGAANNTHYANGKPKNAITQQVTTVTTTAKNTMKGVGLLFFFLVGGLAVGKDILDIGTAILELLGLGLSATGVGAAVGAPLALVGGWLTVIVGLFVDFTIAIYFWCIGGRFAFRLVFTSIGGILDDVPGLDLLPITTLMFVFAYMIGKVKIPTGKTAAKGSTVLKIGKKLIGI